MKDNNFYIFQDKRASELPAPFQRQSPPLFQTIDKDNVQLLYSIATLLFPILDQLMRDYFSGQRDSVTQMSAKAKAIKDK
jgi:hypothetical protein